MLLGQRRRRVASAGIRTVASRKRPPKKTLAPPSHLPRKRTPKKSLAPPSGGKGPQERLWHLPRRGEKTPRKTLAPPSQGGKDLKKDSGTSLAPPSGHLPRAPPSRGTSLADLRALHPSISARCTHARTAVSPRSSSLATWGMVLPLVRTRRTTSAWYSRVKLPRFLLRSMDVLHHIGGVHESGASSPSASRPNTLMGTSCGYCPCVSQMRVRMVFPAFDTKVSMR